MIGAELQKALFDALNAAPAIAGGRVYDAVPPSAAFPYVSIGDDQVIDDGNSCSDGWEVFTNVHVWSRPASGSKVEVKTIAAVVVERLLAIASIAGFSVIVAQMANAGTTRDPDGITEHGIITMRFLLEPV